MTDRDFKLLVIEERRLRAMNPSIDLEPKLHKKFQEVKKLLEKELEDFTRRDVEELPFKETEACYRMKKNIKTRIKQCKPVWGECGKESGHKGAHGEGPFTKPKKP